MANGLLSIRRRVVKEQEGEEEELFKKSKKQRPFPGTYAYYIRGRKHLPSPVLFHLLWITIVHYSNHFISGKKKKLG